jgi:hypothetical protein
MNIFPSIIQLKGGLGNQLFQFAFGCWLEMKFNKKIYFDARPLLNSFTPRSLELQHFTLWDKYSDSFLLDDLDYKKIPIKAYSALLTKMKRRYNESEKLNYQTRFSNGYIFKGFWQQKNIFEEVIQYKKQIFELNLQYNNIKNLNFNINANMVGIHVRGTDYLKHGTLVNLNTQYYNLAIEKIYQEIKDPKFLVISDDLNYARKVLPEIEYTEFKGETAIQDFIAFKNCSHQIIANSTFSWWAAQLNKNSSKLIISPDKWDCLVNNNLITKNMFTIPVY